eukprot:comp6401_c0_seq1/m.2199 comp6401_c0_seq1/g.2199  ORF comp6401_c0_seq1/g.2199 comp6401_c0_seq1/m.2199 type:complete len:306 (-) comp6401_c0_seq1:202-1119(-)
MTAADVHTDIQSDGLFELLLLGSGTSEGVPRVTCVVNGDCAVCVDAARKNVRSKNLRRATCLLVRHRRTSDEPFRNILIDCGKFFWQTALEWFPQHNITHLDAIVLTHDHNDAAYGLDDLRDFSLRKEHPLPVYARDVDMQTLKNAFPYLFPGFNHSAGGGVSLLDFLSFEENKPFEPVPGCVFTPLPVPHGAKGCCGFRFGNISYVSDALCVPDETLTKMHGSEIVFLDMLRLSPLHGSHLTLPQSVAVAQSISPPPKQVYLIGMNHAIGHTEGNEAAKAETGTKGPHVELGYDGLLLQWPASQ